MEASKGITRCFRVSYCDSDAGNIPYSQGFVILKNLDTHSWLALKDSNRNTVHTGNMLKSEIGNLNLYSSFQMNKFKVIVGKELVKDVGSTSSLSNPTKVAIANDENDKLAVNKSLSIGNPLLTKKSNVFQNFSNLPFFHSVSATSKVANPAKKVEAPNQKLELFSFIKVDDKLTEKSREKEALVNPIPVISIPEPVFDKRIKSSANCFEQNPIPNTTLELMRLREAHLASLSKSNFASPAIATIPSSTVTSSSSRPSTSNWMIEPILRSPKGSKFMIELDPKLAMKVSSHCYLHFLYII